MSTVAFATLGCKVNQYDTDVMKTSFLKRGYSLVEFSDEADIYIVNTCTVTGMAARKSRQMVSKASRANPKAVVVVTGCLGQLESDAVFEMTGADIVTGNVEKKSIVDLLEEYTGNRRVIAADIFGETDYSQTDLSTQDSRTRVFIKIQDGCDNFCSYCTIPFARGRSRSRKPGEILEEIEKYANEGTKEVVLTGIHLDSYGKDLKDTDITELLTAIEKIEGISRVRLGSIEPSSVTDEFVNKVSGLTKLCHHFHMSLQSGCDATLGRMKRRYTADDFRKAANLLKTSFEDAALTTDIIVGFPGETDEEFSESIEFAESIGFMKIHVFRYSARKGTLAFGMPGKVPGEIKKVRSELLTALSGKGFAAFAESMSGRIHRVIIEKESEAYPGKWEGHTGNYIKVVFSCTNCSAGDECLVEFDENSDDFVFSSLRDSKRYNNI